MHGIPSCGAGCFVVCCGNLDCEAEGGMCFRDFSPSLFKNIIGYLASFADFSALTVPLVDMISCRRLRWLGRVARMNDGHLPKQLLFGWLSQHCLPYGVKLHWHDNVRCDLRTIHIDKAGWYVLAQDGQEWHRICKGGSSVSSTTRDGRFYCDGCQHSSSRSQDKARHSCDSVRSRHAAGTVSALVACSHCWRTFRRP